MATLEKIRSKSGCLVGVIGFALFAFVVGDFFTGGQSFWRKAQDKVVTVNGEKVTTGDFAKRVNEETDFLKMIYRQSSLNQEQTQQINNEVYNNIVNNALVEAQAEMLGMTVSAEELMEMVSGENVSPMLQQLPFFRNQETGEFDKAALVNFVHAAVEGKAGEDGAKIWSFLERTIKEQRLQTKYLALLDQTIQPNSLELKAQYEAGVKNVDFVYAKQSLSTIPDSVVTVSASEIKDLYNKVKDARYKQKAARSMKYFVVNIKPSAEDREQVETEINKARADFQSTTEITEFVNANSEVPYVDAFVAVSALPADVKQFVSTSNVNDVFGPFVENDTYKMYRLVAKATAPDSLKVRAIVLPANEEKLADSLQTVLNNKGDFAALATQYAANQQLAASQGDLGKMTEADAVRSLGADVKNALTAAGKNKLVKVKTNYGIVLAEITELSKPVAVAKVAEYALTVTPSSRTYNKIYADVNAFIAKNNDIKLIETNAAENNFTVFPATVQSNSFSMGTVRNARQVVRWAFTNKPGSISEVYDIDNNFVVAAVVEELPEGYVALDKVSEQLKRELAGPKKAEKIISELKAKNPSNIEGYAAAMGAKLDSAKFVTFNTPSISGLGREPVLTAMAAEANAGQLTGPVAGKNGVYVFSVYNATDSEAPFNAETEKQSMQRSYSSRIMRQAISVLENKADIEDNRIISY